MPGRENLAATFREPQYRPKVETPPALLDQLNAAAQTGSPKIKKKERAMAVMSALRTEGHGMLGDDVHIITFYPPMEESGLQSNSYKVFVRYPRGDGNNGFVISTRRILREHFRQSDIDELALGTEDIREEPLWERQKRLRMQISGHDRQIEKLKREQRDISRELERRINGKYKYVLAYLHTSMLLEQTDDRLGDMYDWRKSANDIRLIMWETDVTNLPAVLEDKSVKPKLEANRTTEIVSRLDRDELLAKKARYEAGSTVRDDAVGAEICDILDIHPPEEAR